MAKLRAVLFDLGGTVFTYDGLASARLQVARDFAQLLAFGESEGARVLSALRAGTDRSLAELLPQTFYMHRELATRGLIYAAESLGKSLGQLDANRLFDTLMDLTMSSSKLRPGTKETLRELRRRGLHLGAVSNSDEDQMKAMLALQDVGQCFDSALCSETARSCKPHAGIFLQALRQAGCTAEQAVFVGDTPDHDLAGAEAVGMGTVLILETHDLPTRSATSSQRADYRADYVIHEFPELLDILS